MSRASGAACCCCCVLQLLLLPLPAGPPRMGPHRGRCTSVTSHSRCKTRRTDTKHKCASLTKSDICMKSVHICKECPAVLHLHQLQQWYPCHLRASLSKRSSSTCSAPPGSACGTQHAANGHQSSPLPALPHKHARAPDACSSACGPPTHSRLPCMHDTSRAASNGIQACLLAGPPTKPRA